MIGRVPCGPNEGGCLPQPATNRPAPPAFTIAATILWRSIRWRELRFDVSASQSDMRLKGRTLSTVQGQPRFLNRNPNRAKLKYCQSTDMNKDDVIARLRSHEAELKRAGVLRLSVFGSVARGEARPDSDVDLNAQLDRTKRISLFEAVAIENRLSEILGVKADLSIQGTLKPDIQEQFDREAVVAF